MAPLKVLGGLGLIDFKVCGNCSKHVTWTFCKKEKRETKHEILYKLNWKLTAIILASINFLFSLIDVCVIYIILTTSCGYTGDEATGDASLSFVISKLQEKFSSSKSHLPIPSNREQYDEFLWKILFSSIKRDTKDMKIHFASLDNSSTHHVCHNTIFC